MFQFKAKHNRKGPWEFGQLKMIQDLGDHTVSIYHIQHNISSGCALLAKTKMIIRERNTILFEHNNLWPFVIHNKPS